MALRTVVTRFLIVDSCVLGDISTPRLACFLHAAVTHLDRSADVYFIRLLLKMPAVPKNDKPVRASKGSGDAVFGSSGGGSAAATCSGPMEPVRCTVATLVAEPPQIFVAVIL